MAQEKERDRIITRNQADHSLYIDFEGVGRTSDEPKPLPHMLGCYRPKTNGRGAEYRAWLLNPAWTPVANGAGERVTVAELSKTIEFLIDEARERNGFLIYWSDYERKVVEQHCPDRYDQFLDVAFNVKPPVDRVYKSTHAAADETRPDNLVGYMKYYFPKNTETGAIEPGPADSCRRLDLICEKEHRWRNWGDKQKKLASNLLGYNRSDCRSAWKLTLKLAKHLDARN